MLISMIAAVDKNRGIGKNNKLLWHLPKDMEWFKRHTQGKAVVMGRKTYESIGRPLPNRLNIVISRNPKLKIDGAHVVSDWFEAEMLGIERGVTELMVIGGQTVYEDFIISASRLYLTFVDGEFEADRFFPDYEDNWETVYEEEYLADEINKLNMKFVILEERY